MISKWLALAVGLLLVSCSSGPTVSPKMTKSQLFDKTSHTVRGEFLNFFCHFGGVDSLGYPLTDEFVVDGWRVQYFEKGRLEYHPENEMAYRVTVGWLGDLLHRRRPPIPNSSVPAAGKANSRYFSGTGHSLSGDFLRYFLDHGGNVRFGLPISEPFLWEGRLTQDFQSARFFWTPEHDPPVTLENIGAIHLKTITPEQNTGP